MQTCSNEIAASVAVEPSICLRLAFGRTNYCRFYKRPNLTLPNKRLSLANLKVLSIVLCF